MRRLITSRCAMPTTLLVSEDLDTTVHPEMLPLRGGHVAVVVWNGPLGERFFARPVFGCSCFGQGFFGQRILGHSFFELRFFGHTWAKVVRWQAK